MGQTYQTPLTTNVVQATQQKPAKPTRFFDLTEHRFYNHFTPGVQGSSCGCPHFSRRVLHGRGGWLRHWWCWAMVSLAAFGRERVQSQVIRAPGSRIACMDAVIPAA